MMMNNTVSAERGRNELYFVVELDGERKRVVAHKNASLSAVSAIAFGTDPLGDLSVSRMRVIGSTRKFDISAAMMCQSWPEAK